jgi:hypothetical protein
VDELTRERFGDGLPILEQWAKPNPVPPRKRSLTDVRLERLRLWLATSRRADP